MKEKKNMIVVNDDYRLLKGGKIKEGGLARNEAIINWLKDNKAVKEIKLNRNRIVNAFTTIRVLLDSNHETILFFYPTVGIPIIKNGFIGRICSNLYIFLLERALPRNKVILDICDLKYEQAMDLKIDTDRLDALQYTESRLFRCDCDFVFASESMKEYAKKKYGLKDKKCHVLENGGNLCFEKIKIPFTNGKIKLVYAGTLNKGRCIEKMIDRIKTISQATLYLCGTGGEWIKDDGNIVNMGVLDEDAAHYLVSKCDIGLIPYDEGREYYNIAYPTKLAFYVTSGIAFISTDVKEVRKIVSSYGVGYIGEIDHWNNIIETLYEKDLKLQKDKINNIKHEFTWDYKCKNSFLATL